MKNLKALSDSELLEKTRHDAEQERSFGIEVLHDIREITLRRLDAKIGCANLHKFCTQELKYSSGSAWRRIRAMEALQDLPALEEKIATGELTLSNVSQVEAFCAQKGKTVQEKQEIFKKVEGLSKQATDQVLAAIAPQPERPDKVRELDGKKTELRVTLNAETIAALDKIHDLIAHAQPGATYSDVIARLAKIGLQKLDPAAGNGASTGRANVERVIARSVIATPSPENPTPTKPAILTATNREVWRRDGGRCGYASPETGRHLIWLAR